MGFLLFVFFFISSHCEYAYKFVFVKLRNFSRGGLQILILRIPNCRSQEVTWSVIINDHYFYNTNSVEIIFRSWPLPIPLYSIHAPEGGGEGGYCHIWAIKVCAAVKGMVFKQFTLGYGI